MSDPFVTPQPPPGPDSPAGPEIDPAGAPLEAPDVGPAPDSDPADRPVDGSAMATGDSDPR